MSLHSPMTGAALSKTESQLAKAMQGKFIVFDGPDGAGKSTQREACDKALRSGGTEVVSCRDPGGTTIGDRIRSVLLDFDLSTMDVTCETLLFMASRAQLVHEIIAPALREGKTVLCDRFITSTCAYQGAAGFDPERVIELARFAVGDHWPDLTIIFDVDTEEGFDRIGRKPHHAGKNRQKDAGTANLFEGSQPDAMEARSLDFHRRVRNMFLEVHNYYPTPVITVDARGSVDEIHQRTVEAIIHALG